jgi:hypothetical protein
MPGDVNPFEPWRPPASRSDEPAQPWPPPERRPAHREERGEAGEQRDPRDIVNLWPERPGLGSSQPATVWLSIVVAAGGMLALAQLGGGHISRVAATALAAWLGLLVGVSLARRQRWWARLAWVLAGVAGAVAAWLFVPTVGGVSLYQAERAIEEARALAPGDVAGYQAQARERALVGHEFSTRKDELVAAERRWVHKTAEAGLRAVAARRDTEPEVASKELKRLHQDLLRCAPGYVAGGPIPAQILQARRDVLEARVGRGERELEGLLRRGRHEEVAERGQRLMEELRGEAREMQLEDRLLERVVRVRRQALAARAEAGVNSLRGLLRKKQYAEVARVGRGLEDDLRAELAALSEGVAVRERLRAVRREALVAAVSASRSDMEGSFARGELKTVEEAGRKAEKELRGEAADLGRLDLLEQELLPIRRKALVERGARTVRAAEELLAARKFTAAGAAAKSAQAELAAEAQRVNAAGDVEGKLRAVRQRALRGRLDEARSAALMLWAKDRYQALAEAVTQSARELEDEAEAVGLSAELAKFRATWDAVLELARQAGKVERE